MPCNSQRGVVVIAAAALLATLFLAVAALSLAAHSPGTSREATSERAIAQAREALVAYAAERGLDADVGPGYLPCPDLDDDGWAEATCGSLAGEVGQAQRLGRLPWKTLGLTDLRDGHGERLWYAVSTRHKGLLNCASSPGCLDMTPDSAVGTLTMRAADGTLVHDGRRADAHRSAGAAALVLAPGAPLTRRDGWVQRRECGLPECDPFGSCLASPPQRAPRCDPRNYLDVVAWPGGSEDNARFVDRAAPLSRAANGDGFAATAAQGDANDRVAAIGYDDLMPRVSGRVAAEVLHCLRLYASHPASAGRVPWAAPACSAGSQDEAGRHFGRLPAPPFAATHASDPRLPRSWPAGCNLAAGHGWWPRWRPYVFYAVAPPAAPEPAIAGCAGGACLVPVDGSGMPTGSGAAFAVLVSGAELSLASGRQDHARVSSPLDWLEGAHSPRVDPCSAQPPERVTRAAASAAFNDLARLGP